VTPADLERALDEGDAPGCAAFFANATEKERASVAKLVVGRLKKLTGGIAARLIDRVGFLAVEHAGDSLGSVFPHLGVQFRHIHAAQVAALACAPFGELKKLRLRGLAGGESAYAALATRRPPWISEWADFVCDISTGYWSLVRRLVREGVCERPQGGGYIEGMLATVGPRGPGQGSILEALLEDPGLLEHEVWQVFELEPRPQTHLLLADWNGMAPEYSWSAALVKLADTGKVPRPRLLDATLDGLHRDFHEARARWFAGLHEQLSPTVDERAGRADRYLSLLHSRNGSTVAFALKALGIIQKAGRLNAEALFDNLRPALAGRTKGVVRDALKLLDRAARGAGSAGRAAALAAEALLQEWPDVQGLAADVIGRAGRADDATFRELVRERLPGVAASQRDKLVAWLAAAEPVATPAPAPADAPDPDACRERMRALDPRFSEAAGVKEVAAVCEHDGDIPAVAFDPMNVPRLDPERRIEPIEDLDTLLERFAAVLEDPSSPDEVERVLDAVSRLCDQHPTDFHDRAAPLRAQALEVLKNIGRTEWFESALRWGLARLAVRWTERAAPDEWDAIIGTVGPGSGVTLTQPRELYTDAGAGRSALFQARLAGIVRRGARRLAAPLLSAPTHAGGWIDPRTLVDRAKVWQTLGQFPSNLDRALALLRLAPDRRSAALKEAETVEGEFGEALRYALGGEVESIGPTDTLWIAAARARAPFADDDRVEARHPRRGADAGRAVRFRLRPGRHGVVRGTFTDRRQLLESVPTTGSSCPNNLPTVALHSAEAYGYDAGMHRWLATVWPLARESFFAQGFERIAGRDGGLMDLRANRPFLEALFDADAPLKDVGVLLLTGALSAKQAELSLLAVDALIAAIDDGRLDRATLGAALATLLPAGLLVPARLVKSLGAAAKVSPLHAHVIGGALQRGLCCAQELLAGGVNWTGLASLLRLLKELLIERGEPLRLADLRTSLSELQATGSTANLIRQLLSLEEKDSQSALKSAARYALKHRIERAERWGRCHADDDSS
jgi:hypothetical protein